MLIGYIVDVKVIVNGFVGFFVMGGFINYIMYFIVVVCVVGYIVNWDDFLDIFNVVFFFICIYLNGLVDINYFVVVGGMLLLIRQLFDVGLLYNDVKIICGEGLDFYMKEFVFKDGELEW